MNTLKINIYDSPDKAPHYSRDTCDVRGATIKEVAIVMNGTVAKKTTVDFVMESQDGSIFVAMTTGELVQQLAAIIRATSS